ncbi:adenylyl-sulfate kinase [Flammeovirgaceae bacterium SG7u.111]|nr:adenylyl-sulfate kinase [Flammeovirgaceae bacterium SG7u.132]WPO34962.1 adenylyl-sulfate kinase [Flammeovirgaceae bacterium SG7u.111]
MANKDIIPQKVTINQQMRNESFGHKSLAIWFTGLSGSGKSTLANQLEIRLHKAGYHTYMLDGDNVRRGLNKDLAFTADGRKENVRRVGEVARLFTDAGVIVLCAFISPFQADRDEVRALFPEGQFVEVHVSCSLEACEKRDVKGLYEKARKGEIKNFTGIDSPFEAPVSPEIVVHTDKQEEKDSVDMLFTEVVKRIKG